MEFPGEVMINVFDSEKKSCLPAFYLKDTFPVKMSVDNDVLIFDGLDKPDFNMHFPKGTEYRIDLNTGKIEKKEKDLY
jgi:hypothetical protein